MGRIANITIEPPGPKAQEIVAADHAYLATATKSSPLAVSHAEGGQVTDVDGNTYLDFASGISVMNIGHSHPHVVKAVQDQASRLFHFAGTDYYYDVQVRLARKLADVTPGDYEKKVFFSNSGAESVEAAMKISRRSSERKQFLAFIGCFHGRTMGALSLTASKMVQRARYFPLVPGVTHVPYAYCYRCPYRLESGSCDTHCAKVIEEVYLGTLVPPDEVAAMFLEPVLGEGGYIVPPTSFVREMSSICRRHGIILVDDEVQTGMGRTGRLWAIEHFGVVPDIICTSKSLGSGLPIGATVFPKALDLPPGAHSNTFGGNLLCCASSLATFEVMESQGLLENATKVGSHLHRRLLELQERHEIIGDVRGLGMMQATELVKDRRTKEHAVKERDKVIEICFKRGLILLPAGRSSIRYIPPLTVDTDFVDEAMEILDTAFGQTEG